MSELTMKPEDVDGDLVDDAIDAWHEMPRPMALDDQMRHILAAVLPRYEKQLRERIAESIDAELADPNSDYERGLSVAADIARGES